MEAAERFAVVAGGAHLEAVAVLGDEDAVRLDLAPVPIDLRREVRGGAELVDELDVERLEVAVLARADELVAAAPRAAAEEPPDGEAEDLARLADLGAALVDGAPTVAHRLPLVRPELPRVAGAGAVALDEEALHEVDRVGQDDHELDVARGQELVAELHVAALERPPGQPPGGEPGVDGGLDVRVEELAALSHRLPLPAPRRRRAGGGAGGSRRSSRSPRRPSARRWRAG